MTVVNYPYECMYEMIYVSHIQPTEGGHDSRSLILRVFFFFLTSSLLLLEPGTKFEVTNVLVYLRETEFILPCPVIFHVI